MSAPTNPPTAVSGLLACPFCGASGKFLEVTEWVECQSCGATGPECLRGRPVEDWNTRALADAPDTNSVGEK